ncbi:MAG: GNAT family N-acetyltransferase [Candidatus Heimdallarchaeota archaeon]|nr:GNAT family N-acetyltransferase [Candidatus Heimdallarchaeota archaeon]
MEEKDYYLRELSLNDWEKFHEMDKLIFQEDFLREEGFRRSLTGLKSLLVVAVEKETKNFIGYYRIAIYGREGHIQTIGVHPDYRRKGVGSHLLERSIYQLEKSGCTSYFLYVQTNNTPAINLYKKYGFQGETKSWQFVIPFDLLPNKPRGKCRHVEWGEIQLLSLRFNVNPLQIQQYFGKKEQYVLVYEMLGQQLGFARFNPAFPGAFPFILKDPNYFLDMVAILKSYISQKNFTEMKITFENQSRLVNYLKEQKIQLNYSLLKMRKEKDDNSTK